MPYVSQVRPQTQRRIRQPRHTWHLVHAPWTIQPLCLAPVLPGETMKNMLFQARAVTDPLKSPLIGWFLEYYWFYVKLRDLAGRDDFTAMLLDPEKDMTAYHEVASNTYYHVADRIPWSKLCMIRVVEEYFRNEGEAWDDYLSNAGIPVASVHQESWMNSLIADANYVTAEDVVVDDQVGNLMASEVETSMRLWEMSKLQGLTNKSYEDWVRDFGVSMPSAEEPHRPELLRYVREWSYPSNTVNAADGSVASAVSWAIAERADKDRFFKEPGFVTGYTVARPKVYFRNQNGSAAELMDNAFTWLPAVLAGDWSASMRFQAAATGNLPESTDGYWVDIKDLLLYGDQFVNIDLTDALNLDKGHIDLPKPDLTHRYVTAKAEWQTLFSDGTFAATNVRQDGVANFSILGTQMESSPVGGMRSTALAA